MTTIAIAPEALSATITKVLGDLARAVTVQHGEVTVEVSAANYLAAMKKLHTAPGCQFEQLMDLCVLSVLMMIFQPSIPSPKCGPVPTGLSGKPLTCMALCLKVTVICAAS